MLEKTLERPAAKTRTAARIFQLPRQGEWAYEHWLNFPNDGWKYEIIDGVLFMSPAPAIAHQDSSGELFARMRIYASNHSLGKVLEAPTDVYIPGQPVPVQPDILFVRKERLGIIGELAVDGAPDLVVEILSPSNESYDRITKRKLYQRAGVPEYWLVNYWEKRVTIFVLTGGKLALAGKFEVGDTVRSEQLSGFQAEVKALFPE
ncbi:MAG: Uma2 family endonuclease [Anaerolineales bacterium]